VLANNALYRAKLDCGEIIDIFAPGELARVDYCNPADQVFFATREKSGTARFVPDPTRTQFLPPLRNFALNPIGSLKGDGQNAVPVDRSPSPQSVGDHPR
jgi:hypothetical protein